MNMSGYPKKDNASESPVIRFLYTSIPGRLLLKVLVNPKVSIICGRFLSSPTSKFLIPLFISKHGINMSHYVIPVIGYDSFNSFFIRKKTTPIRFSYDSRIIAPCDGMLSIYSIANDSIFTIKNSQYSVSDLIMDEHFSKFFVGGTALIFRLTPAHYHRYVHCTDGVVQEIRRIAGILHSVRPICIGSNEVFVQNSREYMIINNPYLGYIIQMEIGALLVGRISNAPLSTYDRIHMGDEKGFFEYGGSTIIILIPPETVISPELRIYQNTGIEIQIVQGDHIA